MEHAPADPGRRSFMTAGATAAVALALPTSRVRASEATSMVAPPPALASVRSYIQEKVEKAIAPSLVVRVTRQGKPVWAEAFGFADLEERRPAMIDSIYKIASITKPFTLSALMTLVDDGRIDFDAPANRYLRGAQLRAYRGSAEDITLRRLANHTSGIPDHEILFFDGAPRLSPAATVARYGFAAWRPGSRFEYSNLNTAILGFISAEVAGKPWRRFMEDALFEPLGLGSTFAELPPNREVEAAGAAAERLTKQYDYDISGRFVPVGSHITSHPGGSSMSSSAADLSRFAEMHLAGGLFGGRRILSQRAVATMQEFNVPAKEPGITYGNGWISHANLVRHNFNHSGGGPGATAMLAAFPDDGTIIVVLSNHYGGMVTEVTRRIAESLFAAGEPAAAPGAGPATPSGPPVEGSWRGFLRHHAGDIPLMLNILGADAVQMRFGRMPPVALTKVSTANGFLGSTVGPLMRDPGFHGDSIIDFILRVEDGRLIGIADTYAMNYFEVAFWVELDRIS